MTTHGLAESARMRNDLAEAREHYQQAGPMFRELGSRINLYICQIALGLIELARGEFDEVETRVYDLERQLTLSGSEVLLHQLDLLKAGVAADRADWKRWDETLAAGTIPPACPQNYESIGGNTVPEISEDYLYLNVWTSDPSPDADRPVMVWIHGGGLVQRANGLRYRDDLLAYDGEELAERGAVVVTINYRLGPFGFLAHPSLGDTSGEGTPPGNYGLRDQIRALRWVESNIEAFGGNPDNVTVFGESAGAISICSLLTVDATQGLVDRAIMESGYCPTEGQIRRLDTSTGELDSAFDQGQRYVDALGCDGADDVASCLRDASVQELLEARQTGLGATAVRPKPPPACTPPTATMRTPICSRTCVPCGRTSASAPSTAPRCPSSSTTTARAGGTPTASSPTRCRPGGISSPATETRAAWRGRAGRHTLSRRTGHSS